MDAVQVRGFKREANGCHAKENSSEMRSGDTRVVHLSEAEYYPLFC
jgi:hypothetical protein